MASQYPLTRIRKEVDSCIEIWKTVLEDWFPVELEYAYAKGSCIKLWDSPIDYVPILSDVDIHIKQVNNIYPFENSFNGFKDALKLSEVYEDRFLEMHPDPLHIPRTQIVRVDPHLDDPEFVLPWSREQIRPMFGKPQLSEPPIHDQLRDIDLRNLLEQEEALKSLPMSACDRTGLDAWVLIRRLNWRVSPTPVRLLSQMVDPSHVWHWNRTRICKELEKHGYTDLSETSRHYYMAGWEMFTTGFNDSKSMWQVLSYAYRVLEASVRYAKELNAA